MRKFKVIPLVVLGAMAASQVEATPVPPQGKGESVLKRVLSEIQPVQPQLVGPGEDAWDQSWEQSWPQWSQCVNPNGC